MRVKILKYQQEFYKNARNSKQNKAIVFGDEKDGAKAYHLAKVLKKHNITIHKLKDNFSSNGKNFSAANSYVVPMNQKNHRLVQAMFDVRTQFTDSLFYDVSAWTFNHAFGVDFAKNVSLSKAGKKIEDLSLRQGTINLKSEVGYLMPVSYTHLTLPTTPYV